MFAVAAMATSCIDNNDAHVQKLDMTAQEYNSNSYRSIYVVELDGCEYVVNKNAYSGGVCHKGNCKNELHKKSPTIR